MALLDENSEKYLQECDEKNQEPDKTKLVGMAREDILNFFYKSQIYQFNSDQWVTNFSESNFKGQRLNFDLIDYSKNKVVAKAGEKITQRKLKSFVENGLESIGVKEEEIIGKYIAEDIINENTGEVYAEAGDEVTEELIKLFKLNALHTLKVLSIDNSSVGPRSN